MSKGHSLFIDVTFSCQPRGKLKWYMLKNFDVSNKKSRFLITGGSSEIVYVIRMSKSKVGVTIIGKSVMDLARESCVYC